MNAAVTTVSLSAVLSACAAHPASTGPQASDRVFVPGGPFVAGADCNAARVEPGCDRSLVGGAPGARRTVVLDAFFVDRDPVSAAAYRQCVDARICLPGEEERNGFAFVSLAGARSYCRWKGLSLPTSDQFERIARGTDGRTEPWGNAPSPCRDSRPTAACLAYEGPAGARSAALVPQWVEEGWVRGAGTFVFEIDEPEGRAAFRCAERAP